MIAVVELAILLAASAVQAATLTTLVSFDGDNGTNPYGSLIADVSGHLYGTTRGGGPRLFGTVFKLDPTNGDLTTLVSFGFDNGSAPWAGLIIDLNGNLYGTTSNGGSYSYGTVFKLNPTTHEHTTLASFDDDSYGIPNAGLIADAAGNLYGTTTGGGMSGLGTVFKLSPTTGDLTTLVSFDGANGLIPFAELTTDAAGNLYGAARGGLYGYGTVFKLEPTSGLFSTLVSFDGANGQGLDSGLLANSDGTLYGVTSGNRRDDHGTIFRLDPASGELTTLVRFDGANGRQPTGVLIADTVGNLYGTTRLGGVSDHGTVFKLDAISGNLTTLASFDSLNGSRPYAGLLADVAGNLYGTTTESGLNGFGTVFKLSGTGFVVVPEPAGLTLLVMSAAANGVMKRRRY